MVAAKSETDVYSELSSSSRKRIVYVQYTNPAGYPPLEHSSQILASAGWQVLFLGVGALGTAALKFPAHDRITVQQISFSPPGWRQKLHYIRFCLWVINRTISWKPQWVYASEPLACPVALLLRLVTGVGVLYHEHDSPSRQAVGLFSRFVLWTREVLARRAQIRVLPNEQRALVFASETGARGVFSVWNCPRLSEVGSPKSTPPKEKLMVYYHGNLGSEYLPLNVLRAMASLPNDVYLKVIGYETLGSRGYRDSLLEEARHLGIARRVEFIDAMARRELLEQCSTSDVGLAFIPYRADDLNNLHMLGASNKPFDYLACGLALLVSDLPEWRKAYVEPGYGLACNPEEPESIAATLRWFHTHREEMRVMGEQGRQRICNEWNYERQFNKVFKALQSSWPSAANPS